MVDLNDMQKVKETVMKGEGYLHIKRLPKNTIREIINFLNDADEFGGDWAVGMKFIWDTFKGVIPPKDGAVLNEIQVLHERIDVLEEQVKSKNNTTNQPAKKRMADGNVRGNEENGKV